MRWGIPSIALTSHSTVDMCLQELDTCCRLSMATNCVVSKFHFLFLNICFLFEDSIKSSIW